MNRIDTLPPEIELAQLLQRCAAQDTAAFRTLYDKTSPILFAGGCDVYRPVSSFIFGKGYVRRTSQSEFGTEVLR